MRSKRQSKAHAKAMLSGNGLEMGEEGNGSRDRLPCHSALCNLRGWETVKVSRNYPKGTTLFGEGHKPRGIYVLCDGRVKISIASADGKTLVLRIARPGDLLGLSANLTGQPYAATAETLERCRIDFVSRDDLMRLIARDRKGYVAVIEELSRRLSGLVDHTRLLFLSGSASEKLARLLLNWCDEHGKRTNQGIRIKPGLTHEEIAQMIGTSRETVTRVFNQLKRNHLVQAVDGDLLVRNRSALLVEVTG
jgi:CRP/FNR family transcriptional regulator